MPEVEEFAWDDENERKVAGHGLSPSSVDDILAGRIAVFANRRGMPGAFQLVGRDFNGRYITVIIQPTTIDRRLWRPLTAWLSKTGEKTRAKHQGV